MIDVYSNSWGPGDMGFEVEGPGPKLKKVLENGTRLVGINKQLLNEAEYHLNWIKEFEEGPQGRGELHPLRFP